MGAVPVRTRDSLKSTPYPRNPLAPFPPGMAAPFLGFVSGQRIAYSGLVEVVSSGGGARLCRLLHLELDDPTLAHGERPVIVLCAAAADDGGGGGSPQLPFTPSARGTAHVLTPDLLGSVRFHGMPPAPGVLSLQLMPPPPGGGADDGSPPAAPEELQLRPVGDGLPATWNAAANGLAQRFSYHWQREVAELQQPRGESSEGGGAPPASFESVAAASSSSSEAGDGSGGGSAVSRLAVRKDVLEVADSIARMLDRVSHVRGARAGLSRKEHKRRALDAHLGAVVAHILAATPPGGAAAAAAAAGLAAPPSSSAGAAAAADAASHDAPPAPASLSSTAPASPPDEVPPPGAGMAVALGTGPTQFVPDTIPRPQSGPRSKPAPSGRGGRGGGGGAGVAAAALGGPPARSSSSPLPEHDEGASALASGASASRLRKLVAAQSRQLASLQAALAALTLRQQQREQHPPLVAGGGDGSLPEGGGGSGLASHYHHAAFLQQQQQQLQLALPTPGGRFEAHSGGGLFIAPAAAAAYAQQVQLQQLQQLQQLHPSHWQAQGVAWPTSPPPPAGGGSGHLPRAAAGRFSPGGRSW